MPDLSRRSHAPEWMDDLGIRDERLTRSLDQLRGVNRLLGGYRCVYDGLQPFLRRRGERPTSLLDVGTGIADIPAFLLQDSGIRRWDLSVVAVDFNPATVEHAAAYLRRTLDPSVATRVRVDAADAAALPYADGAFDAAMASMFLHHFTAAQAAAILREMGRVAGGSVLVSDLHRHEAAYLGIAALTRLLPATPMVRHDAPLSVARGFTAAELYRCARRAGLRNIRIRWRWAFRWVMTTGELSAG